MTINIKPSIILALKGSPAHHRVLENLDKEAKLLFDHPEMQNTYKQVMEAMHLATTKRSLEAQADIYIKKGKIINTEVVPRLNPLLTAKKDNNVYVFVTPVKQKKSDKPIIQRLYDYVATASMISIKSLINSSSIKLRQMPICSSLDLDIQKAVLKGFKIEMGNFAKEYYKKMNTVFAELGHKKQKNY